MEYLQTKKKVNFDDHEKSEEERFLKSVYKQPHALCTQIHRKLKRIKSVLMRNHGSSNKTGLKFG